MHTGHVDVSVLVLSDLLLRRFDGDVEIHLMHVGGC